MSRWSPESLLISLYANRVVAARLESGWRTRIIDKRVVETPIEKPDPTGTGPPGPEVTAAARSAAIHPWRTTIAAVDQLLGSDGVRGLPATIVISSRFVRYAIVPWRDNVLGAREQEEFARHCFRGLYGDASSGWEIRLSSGGFRRNALASAVDAGLLRELEKTCAGRGVPIASIQPNFMAACNRFRRELSGHRSAGIAVLEPGRVALGLFDTTGWHTLGTRRVRSLRPEELVAVVAQELRSSMPDRLPDDLFVAAVGPTTSSFFRTRTQAWLQPGQTRIPESVS